MYRCTICNFKVEGWEWWALFREAHRFETKHWSYMDWWCGNRRFRFISCWSIGFWKHWTSIKRQLLLDLTHNRKRNAMSTMVLASDKEQDIMKRSLDLILLCVDGRNPAPTERSLVFIPWFIGFHTSQDLEDFDHQHYFCPLYQSDSIHHELHWHCIPQKPKSHKKASETISLKKKTRQEILFICSSFLSFSSNFHRSSKVHPGRLTWNIITEVCKMIFRSKWVICRFQPLIFQGVSKRHLCCFPTSNWSHHFSVRPPLRSDSQTCTWLQKFLWMAEEPLDPPSQ